MKKKVIAHIIPRFYSGGAERLVLEYAKRLNKEKYDVHIITCVEDGNFREEFEKIKGISIFTGSRKKHGGRFVVLKAVHKYLDKIQPDIIHSHLLSSDVTVFLYKRKTRRPFYWISTLHNVEYNSPMLHRIIWRYVLRKVNKIIAVAPAVSEYAIKKFKITKNKINIILNGIDVGLWSNAKKYKIFENKKIIFATIGRLEKQKGHVFLLKALSQLSFLNWEYHIYGDGSLEKKLKQLAINLKINNKIVWHGMTQNMHEEIKNVDLIIQPSLWEGLSLVIMEAMSAGRCVLATDMAGDGIIKNGINGYIVPSANSNALTKQIEYILSHRKEARDISNNGFFDATKRFGIDKNISKVENLYNKI